MPGVLRFGKRSTYLVGMDDDFPGVSKKEMPGVLRFGKRATGYGEKKAVPGKRFLMKLYVPYLL